MKMVETGGMYYTNQTTLAQPPGRITWLQSPSSIEPCIEDALRTCLRGKMRSRISSSSSFFSDLALGKLAYASKAQTVN